MGQLRVEQGATQAERGSCASTFLNLAATCLTCAETACLVTIQLAITVCLRLADVSVRGRQATSEMKFPRTRSGEHAVQAVSILARQAPSDGAREAPEGAERGWRRGGFLAPQRTGLRSYTFTFCLERVAKGPYKDCWMTVGLRCGDYASV